jgi:hypothetical protein
MLKCCGSSESDREELRKRFVKAETALFRVRYDKDDTKERDEFLRSMRFDWSEVCQNLPSRMNH